MRTRVGVLGKSKTRMIGGAIGAALLVIGGGGFAAAQQRGQAFTAAVSASQAEVFVGVTPTRVLDTRQQGQTPFAAGETRTLSFSSYVPPEATSVALALVSPANATVISYFTIWPTGTPRPETSVLNPGSPYDLAASSMQKLGTNRSVDVYNRFGEAHIVVDLMGYFVPLASVDGIGAVLSGAAGEGSQFHIGDGPPDNSLGDDGDIYYDVINKIFYEKENGDWGDGSSAVGPAGPPGAAGQSAYEIAVENGFVGTEAQWLASLEGTDGTNGASFLSGAADPLPAQGANGDTYINLTTGDVFTKSGGVWTLSGNLEGPQGPAGTMGPGISATDSGSALLALPGTDTVPYTQNVVAYGLPAITQTGGVFTIPATGTYRVAYQVATTAGLIASTEAVINGATGIPQSASGGLLSSNRYDSEFLVALNTGDTIEIEITAALGLTTADGTYILIEQVA